MPKNTLSKEFFCSQAVDFEGIFNVLSQTPSHKSEEPNQVHDQALERPKSDALVVLIGAGTCLKPVLDELTLDLADAGGVGHRHEPCHHHLLVDVLCVQLDVLR